MPVQAGLCVDCTHARRIESDRGSVFYMCQLALTDSRFKKYPRLPVLSCAGYESSGQSSVVSHKGKTDDPKPQG
jgi:hypothetical protein